MTMTLYAAYSGALPYLKSGIYSVYYRSYPKLFIICSSFSVIHGVSMESRCNELVNGWLR